MEYDESLKSDIEELHRMKLRSSSCWLLLFLLNKIGQKKETYIK